MEIAAGNFTVSDVVDWRDRKLLVIAAKFQRRGVWRNAAKSYLIDTILRGYPVPPIYVRPIDADEIDRKEYTQKLAQTGTIREVIDGQQRLTAVLEYIDGSFSLSKSLDSKFAGKLFSELPKAEQRRIKSYSFQSQNFSGASDAMVLGIFARLNTHTVKLNKQELRNGQYFGPFKQVCYSLAATYVEFWRQKRIFSNIGIARMLEVELTSELLIASLHGMQDKKKSIESFYKKYDVRFAKRAQAEGRFRQVMTAIDEVIGDDLGDTEFRRGPLFYTLYCVIYHRMYGLPGEKVKTPARALTSGEREALRDAVVGLSEVYESRDEGVAPEYVNFIEACLRQTDNIGPRRTRFREVYRAF